MLRLDWNILFNIINLIILYVLMKRFLFGPVNKILAKRQTEADSRFVQADEREKKAEEQRAQYENLLRDAEGEKRKIVAEAREEAVREYDRIVDGAKEKADDIVEKAKTDANHEKDAIIRQADADVRDMVIQAAAKVSAQAANAENDRALYDRFLENMDIGCGSET